MSEEKKSRKRLVPPVAHPDCWVDFRRPRAASMVAQSAGSYLRWLEAESKWKEKCREAVKAGQTCPPPPKPIDLNRGRISFETLAKWSEHVNDGKEVDRFYTPYQPVDVQAAADMGILALYRGQPAKHPAKPDNWQDEYGEWRPGDFIAGPRKVVNYDNGVVTSSAFDRQVRICHSRDVRRLIQKNETGPNIVSIGGREYGVGTGGIDGSIVRLVGACITGCYEAVEIQRLVASTDKLTGLPNLVVQFNNETTIVKLPSGDEVVWLPNQLMVFGYLLDGDGKQLTPAQIRKLAESEDESAAVFEPIPEYDAAWVGAAIPWDSLWKATQTQLGRTGVAKLRDRAGWDGEAGNAQERASRNSLVQMRISPDNMTPLKIASSQIGLVPYYVSDVGGNISQGVAIGCRSNDHLISGKAVAKRQAKATVATEEGAESGEAAAPKKSTKKKSTKKKSSKKTAKGKGKAESADKAGKADKPKRNRKRKESVAEAVAAETAVEVLESLEDSSSEGVSEDVAEVVSEDAAVEDAAVVG